jgi:hypothetical protein
MFTHETIRTSLQANADLTRVLSGQVMDFQTAAVLNTQKQFNSYFDGFRGMMDLSQKSVRSMQHTLVDHVSPTPAPSADV